MPTGASYTVEAGRYCFSHTYTDSAWAASGICDLPTSMSVSDYSCRVNAIHNEGDILGIVIRGNPLMEFGYGLFVRFSGIDSYVYLMRIDGVGQGQMLAIQPCSLASGQEYWLRIEMKGNLIGAKYWTGNVGDEPGTWNLTAHIPHPYNAFSDNIL